MKPIFVVGAVGRHGGTGGSVAHQLLDQGYKVRALTRTADARAEQLRSRGAEIVTGDLHDRRTLLPALQDVEMAYFTYPIADGIVDAAANFASAAREAQVKRVVVMSMAPANPQSPSALGRAQWLAEEVLDWAGFDCIFLRVAALFVENLNLLHGDEIRDAGVIRNSFADVPVHWMTGEDAGKLAVAALLHPERLCGKKVVYPTGPNRYTHAEIGSILSNQLGRPVRHETIGQDELTKNLQGLSERDSRVTEGMAAHISVVGAMLVKSMPTNKTFEELTMGSARTLEDALRSEALKQLGKESTDDE